MRKQSSVMGSMEWTRVRSRGDDETLAGASRRSMRERWEMRPWRQHEITGDL